jgi:hypothetical protein
MKKSRSCWRLWVRQMVQASRVAERPVGEPALTRMVPYSVFFTRFYWTGTDRGPPCTPDKWRSLLRFYRVIWHLTGRGA